MSRRRTVALGVALVAVAAGGYVATRLVSLAPAVLPPTGAAAFDDWYCPEGIIRPEGGAGIPGIASPAHDWIVLLNLSRLPALVTATFYFEELAPRSTTLLVPGHGRRRLMPDALPDLVPRDTRYGLRVTSTAPIIVQPTRGEYTPGDPVTEAMASFVAYPGPLGTRETRWAYADGIVLASDEPLEEREWITILNPDPARAASLTLVFLLNDGRRTMPLAVPAARLRSVDLFDLPLVPKNIGFGVVVESDVPVVVEQVRRAYRKGNPTTVSLFACLAQPIGGAALDGDAK